MLDKSGNEIRYYKVTYTRNMSKMPGSERLKAHGVMCEWQLQQMLYDFHSMYGYIVLSAEYLPDYVLPVYDYDD